MKKSVLGRVEPGTPEYVVLHGLWQLSRGRKFSEPYGWVRNPQQAFNAALWTLFYTTPPVEGCNPQEYIQWMTTVSTLIRKPLQAVVNGVTVTVWPGDSADEVLSQLLIERFRRIFAWFDDYELDEDMDDAGEPVVLIIGLS